MLALLATGALAGLLAGFFGIGGGMVLTPLCLMLYPSLGIGDDALIKIIFGTNMFLVMAFSISAVIRHHKNLLIEWKTVIKMGPLAIAGSVFGAWLASVSDPMYLKKGFGIFLVAASLSIILKGSLKPEHPEESHKLHVSHKFLPLLGFTAGMLGSLLGIGGGAVMITALILFFSFPIEKVAGTSSSVIIFIGFAGMFSYIMYGLDKVMLPGWSSGYVWWSSAIPLAIGGIPAAQAGAWLNSKIHAGILKRLFGIVLFVTSLKILLGM